MKKIKYLFYLRMKKQTAACTGQFKERMQFNIQLKKALWSSNKTTVNERISPRGLFVKMAFRGGGLFGRGAY